MEGYAGKRKCHAINKVNKKFIFMTKCLSSCPVCSKSAKIKLGFLQQQQQLLLLLFLFIHFTATTRSHMQNSFDYCHIKGFSFLSLCLVRFCRNKFQIKNVIYLINFEMGQIIYAFCLLLRRRFLLLFFLFLHSVRTSSGARKVQCAMREKQKIE